MRTTKSEFEQMTVYPQEFVNIGLDVCHQQDADTVKSKAASLLEGMCDNVDGSVTTLVQYCTSALSFVLA